MLPARNRPIGDDDDDDGGRGDDGHLRYDHRGTSTRI